MAQFDVFRNPRGGTFPLLLDVQSELLSELATRVVVPLAPVRQWPATPLTRLNPMARLRQVDYVLVFQELAAIPKAALGPTVGSLRARRDDIVGALDLLFTGI
ncbi:MAG: CcdB family protein [bacterium]|nr:CcdB family protein [bacterium]